MRKILFIAFLMFILLFVGETYSYKNKSGEDAKYYLLTVNSITSKNINLIENCSQKLITIYPDSTYINFDFYNLYINNSIKDFEKNYLMKILKVSKSKYYELKINGVKINKIKVLSTNDELKKCYNYLEKVEPL